MAWLNIIQVSSLLTVDSRHGRHIKVMEMIELNVCNSFLCQLTCQSADIMSSLCGVGVRVNNFFSKTTRPRDMLFFLKDTLSIEDEKLFQGMQICLFVCLLETLQGRYPHQKCENFNFLSQFSQ